jgi:hypothetical protein
VPDNLNEILSQDSEKTLDYIQRVRSCNDEGNMVAICLKNEQDPTTNIILTWSLYDNDKQDVKDVKVNYERGQYVIKDPYFFAFDQKGDMFLVHEDEKKQTINQDEDERRAI